MNAKRIEYAWDRFHAMMQLWDGELFEFYYPEISESMLIVGVDELIRISESFNVREDEFICLKETIDIPTTLNLILQKFKISEVPTATFSFNIKLSKIIYNFSLIIDLTENDLYNINIVWDPENAFGKLFEKGDVVSLIESQYGIFADILNYIFYMQMMFDSKKTYMSRETPTFPKDVANDWVEL